MTGEKISNQLGTISVPDYPIIPFMEGDGSGPDIWAATVRALDAAVEAAYGGKRRIVWKEVLVGQKAFERSGKWLPEESLDTIHEHLIAIKGPLAAPEGGGIRSLNIALRQILDLYVCLRPLRYYRGVPSPLKDPTATNVVVFSENSEDLQTGIEWMTGTEEGEKVKKFLQDQMGVSTLRFPESASIGIKPISKEGTSRLVRASIQYAVRHKLPSVTLVHKGDIMAFTEGQFKEWGYELAEEEFGDLVFTWKQYDNIAAQEGQDQADASLAAAQKAGKILIKDLMAGAFLQQILIRPAEYSVIATMNLNGDYISDTLTAIVGGIGVAPGASINYESGHALFEAMHGPVPEYAGQDKMNPGSLILSGVLMLQYMGWDQAARILTRGLQEAILSKKVTCDFAPLMEKPEELSCSEFGDVIIEQMKINH